MDVIGIGSSFIDYFFEADSLYLKSKNISPEDDLWYDDEGKYHDVVSPLNSLSKSTGGSTPNVLSVLSQLDLTVAYSGAVGSDPESSFWEKGIPKVNLDKVIKKGSISKCACILTNRRRERTFVSYMNPFDNEFFNHPDISFLNSAQYLTVAQFFLHPKRSRRRLEALLEKINNPKICFSPGVAHSLDGVDNLRNILSKTHVLFLSKNELNILCHKSPEEGSKYLLNFGPSYVVCTLGEKGSLVATKEGIYFQESITPTKIVDTTSAGDSFQAAFIYGLVKKLPLEKTMLFSTRVASKSLEDYGCIWLKKEHLTTLLP